MLERNRVEVDNPAVTYVHGDIFEWASPQRYDTIFFGFWLSHVPPAAFDRFWHLVGSWLAPHGRVGFIDEDARAASNDETLLVDGVPMARRHLSDGRDVHIVKMFWNPEELEARLRALGWDAAVRAVGEEYLFGTARA